MGKRDKRKKKRGRRKSEAEPRGPAPQKLEPPPVRLEAIGEHAWRVARRGAMRVPGLIFAKGRIIEAVKRDQGAQQVANVATLPGIVGQAIAMPDIHWGYGFPIGGVAAFDEREGVVSPGGIGYDINCGVRLFALDIAVGELGHRLPDIVEHLQRTIPAGLGRKRRGEGLEQRELERVLLRGARAAVEMGYGEQSDLERIEDGGQLGDADPEVVSDRARERGAGQLGSLGSGNHFVELQRAEQILLPEVAEAFGIFKGQLLVMIHTGSRGLGHQVCTDAVKTMGAVSRDAGIALPDRQLACAPLGSEAARRYLAAMAAAANYAFANRQVLSQLALEAIAEALELKPSAVAGRLVYDVAHNIAKWERHTVEGKARRVLVHRKGATRAFGPARSAEKRLELPAEYRPHGQPVLVPGDMGRASWVLVGTEEAGQLSFSSSCHGAGRRLSRTEALKRGKGRKIADELEKEGIVVRAESRRTLAEEMPEAYKNVDDVVDVITGAGICRAVARLTPLGVIKG